MNTRFIDVAGQKLAYFESSAADAVPGSPSVLFVPGNSQSARSYLKQLESPLGDRFRLVVLDLPGHGLSAQAADPAVTYTVSGLVDTLCRFIEKTGLTDAVCVGWSLGGNILIESIDRRPSVRALMIVGTFLAPKPFDMSKVALPHPCFASLFTADITDEQIDMWASAILKPGADVPPFLAEDIRKTDKRFRSSVGEAIARGEHEDEVAIVSNLKIPLAIVLGAEDQLVRTDFLRGLRMPTLWRDDLQIIPDAGHLPLWEQPEKFNTILEEFVRDAGAGRPA